MCIAALSNNDDAVVGFWPKEDNYGPGAELTIIELGP